MKKAEVLEELKAISSAFKECKKENKSKPED